MAKPRKILVEIGNASSVLNLGDEVTFEDPKTGKELGTYSYATFASWFHLAKPPIAGFLVQLAPGQEALVRRVDDD